MGGCPEVASPEGPDPAWSGDGAGGPHLGEVGLPASSIYLGIAGASAADRISLTVSLTTPCVARGPVARL